MEKIEISSSDAFYVRALMSRGYSEIVNFQNQMLKLLESPEWGNVPGSIRDSVRGSCLHAEQLRSEAAEVVNRLPHEIKFMHNWTPLDPAPHYDRYAGKVVNGDIV